jgi:hypothetical protein
MPLGDESTDFITQRNEDGLRIVTKAWIDTAE